MSEKYELQKDLTRKGKSESNKSEETRKLKATKIDSRSSVSL